MTLLESARLNLDLGCQGLTVVQHVLNLGREELLRVERGDDL